LFGVWVPRLAEPEYFWYDTALLLRRLGLNLVCVVFNGYGYAQAVTPNSLAWPLAGSFAGFLTFLRSRNARTALHCVSGRERKRKAAVR
jgi:hypothetical protein